jgi:hypothetical protein
MIKISKKIRKWENMLKKHNIIIFLETLNYRSL